MALSLPLLPLLLLLLLLLLPLLQAEPNTASEQVVVGATNQGESPFSGKQLSLSVVLVEGHSLARHWNTNARRDVLVALALAFFLVRLPLVALNVTPAG